MKNKRMKEEINSRSKTRDGANDSKKVTNQRRVFSRHRVFNSES